MRPENRKELLHPAMRRAVEAVEADLAREGLPFRLHETWRSRERQEAGKTRGTSQAGMWQSYHNYGMAVDFVGADGGNPWSPSLPWTRLGEVYERHGLGWGGRWRGFVDLVHGEMSGIYSWRELQNGAIADPNLARNAGVPGGEWAQWMRWFWGVATELRPAMTSVLQRHTGLSTSDPEALISAAARQLGSRSGGLVGAVNQQRKLLLWSGGAVVALTFTLLLVRRLQARRAATSGSP